MHVRECACLMARLVTRTLDSDFTRKKTGQQALLHPIQGGYRGSILGLHLHSSALLPGSRLQAGCCCCCIMLGMYLTARQGYFRGENFCSSRVWLFQLDNLVYLWMRTFTACNCERLCTIFLPSQFLDVYRCFFIHMRNSCSLHPQCSLSPLSLAFSLSRCLPPSMSYVSPSQPGLGR